MDLNYTATPDRAQEQSFYALQVTLPCSRIWEGQNDNLTYTSLCYNHYHPEYFSSISETGRQSANFLRLETVYTLLVYLVNEFFLLFATEPKTQTECDLTVTWQ